VQFIGKIAGKSEVAEKIGVLAGPVIRAGQSGKADSLTRLRLAPIVLCINNGIL
jgi:hypothetical protein